jgi:hypothetical protein
MQLKLTYWTEEPDVCEWFDLKWKFLFLGRPEVLCIDTHYDHFIELYPRFEVSLL